jgi:hypothetical protein
VAAWKAYGVTVEQSVLDELARRWRFHQDKFRPDRMSVFR